VSTSLTLREEALTHGGLLRKPTKTRGGTPRSSGEKGREDTRDLKVCPRRREKTALKELARTLKSRLQNREGKDSKKGKGKMKRHEEKRLNREAL